MAEARNIQGPLLNQIAWTALSNISAMDVLSFVLGQILRPALARIIGFLKTDMAECQVDRADDNDRGNEQTRKG